MLYKYAYSGTIAFFAFNNTPGADVRCAYNTQCNICKLYRGGHKNSLQNIKVYSKERFCCIIPLNTMTTITCE